MLLTKSVEVRVIGKTLQHYLSLGYDVKVLDKIIVPIEHLTKGSHALVDVQCDICGEQIQRPYKQYLHCHNNMDVCVKCKSQKMINTLQEKYGVNNCMELDFVKEKLKNTFLERYGFEHPSQVPIFQEKVKETSLKNFGVTHPTKSLKIKNKTKITNLKKYGVVSYTQTKEYLEKTRETCLRKYGTTNIACAKSTRDKYKNTMYNKYGVDNYFATDEFKAYITEYNLEKYGVEHISQADETKLKVRETWEEKSEEEIAEIAEKRNQTLYKNDTQKCSSQQKSIYDTLSIYYDNVFLNYPEDKFSLDIMLEKDNVKIDIEYDGWYWHQDKKRDYVRDYINIKSGYKVFRIKSGSLIPTVKQLQENIDILLNTDKKFIELYLDDWREIA